MGSRLDTGLTQVDSSTAGAGSASTQVPTGPAPSSQGLRGGDRGVNLAVGGSFPEGGRGVRSPLPPRLGWGTRSLRLVLCCVGEVADPAAGVLEAPATSRALEGWASVLDSRRVGLCQGEGPISRTPHVSCSRSPHPSTDRWLPSPFLRGPRHRGGGPQAARGSAVSPPGEGHVPSLWQPGEGGRQGSGAVGGTLPLLLLPAPLPPAPPWLCVASESFWNASCSLPLLTAVGLLPPGKSRRHHL